MVLALSSKAREEIPILKKYIYLNNASAGPLPSRVVASVVKFAEEWASEGEPWEEGIRAIYDCKRLFSQLIGARPEEVSAFPGVSYGIALVLSSLRLKPGSNVVVSSMNFPTSLAIARSMARRGLVKEVRVVEDRGGFTDLRDYEKLIDDNTALVLVDYVGWLSGYVEDLREVSRIAHEHGAILVSDAFHAVGVLPVDVKALGVDVLVTGSYKWLMSLHGAALAYVRDEVLESLNPPYAGWMALEDSVPRRILRGEPEFLRPIDPLRTELARDGGKLEWGTLPLVAFVALRSALEFILEYRAPELFENHTRKLVERLIEGFEDLGYELYTARGRHAAIVSFKHRSPIQLAEHLGRAGVVVSGRPGLVRVSPHFYNTHEDVDNFLETLRRVDRELRG
jgi:cysteine desulfurase/selenocysteine lyase